MAESFNSRKGKVEAALDAKKVSYLKEIQKTDASIVELSADHLRTLRDTDKEYAKNIAKLKEINAEQQKFKQGNVDAERGLKSLTGIYTNLGGMERERLTMQNSLSSVNEKHIGHFNNIASLNQDLAKLSADDVIQRQLILEQQNMMNSILAKSKEPGNAQINLVVNLENDLTKAKQVITKHMKNIINYEPTGIPDGRTA
jgi:hypothetical protein